MSSGNFKGIRKGSICGFGQIVGGTKDYAYIRNNENKRISKSLKKINWLSHSFKIKSNSAKPLRTKSYSAIVPTTKVMGILVPNNIL